MDSWGSYPSVYALGHRALAELLRDEVLVEEKIDGSQFSFGVFWDETSGNVLRCRSKGAELNIIAPDAMFQRGVEVVRGLADNLTVGWTYRAEYLCQPKHNVLAYDRIPKDHLILFDVTTGLETYLSHEEKSAEAARLGLEVVPKLYYGQVEDLQQFRTFLEKPSCLGGQKVEGVVVKNYWRFGVDKKVLLGKFVSEEFKEVHAQEWRATHPTPGDIVQRLIASLKTPARWYKAMQHLRERGLLEESPQDIGPLMKEVPADVEKEEIEFIKDHLYQWAWPQIRRGIVKGLPEWYKEELLKRQFEPTSSPQRATA